MWGKKTWRPQPKVDDTDLITKLFGLILIVNTTLHSMMLVWIILHSGYSILPAMVALVGISWMTTTVLIKKLESWL